MANMSTPDAPMSPARWSQIRELFNLALDQPGDNVENFLHETCGIDHELYAIVWRMVEEDRRSGVLDASLSYDQTGDLLVKQEPSTVEKEMSAELVGGRYQRLECVGAGGMGEVFRAKDRLTGEIVALKQIRARGSVGQSATTGPFSQDPLSSPPLSRPAPSRRLGLRAAALAREFRVLSSLRHPNIITVLDYGFAGDGSPFFIMPLLEDAQRVTAASAKLSFDLKLQFLFQILQALSYLHRHGICHRDLKPSNILVSGGRVVLLDFGISGLSSQSFVGTLSYMAPELLHKARPSIGSDLYAFGVVAFEILSGRGPKRIQLDLLSKSLGAVIDRLLETDPALRYANSDQVAHDLAAVSGLAQPTETIAHRESYLRAAPLIGRRSELYELMKTLRSARRRSGACLLLGGESGVGKTRLMDEFRTRAMLRGVLALSGRAEEGHSAPFSILKAIFLRLSLLVPLEDSEAVTLRTVFPDIQRVLDRPIQEVTAGDDAQTLSDRLANCIEALLVRYNKPVLLILEDCHNMVEELPVVRHLSMIARGLALLILVSYRSEERPDLPAELPKARAIHIQRMKRGEIRGLAVAMLGEELGGDGTLLQFLERETEGNVFFLVEAVRVLAEERGSLSNLRPEALPATVFAGGIQETVRRRLASAPPWARQHLHLSAIIGREVNPQILSTAGVGEQLEPFLLLCDRLAILEGHGYNWRFTHEKVREGILREVDATIGVQLHRRVAWAIEACFEGNPDWFQALAFHWRQGGIIEKSGSYALRAAHQTLSLGMPEKAVDLLLDALAGMGIELPGETAALAEAIGKEAAYAQEMLAVRTHEELSNLRPPTDPRIGQMIDILKIIQPAAHMSQRGDLYVISALKCMTLTLEHGAGSWAPEVFALYGALMQGMTADCAAAAKYIQLAKHYDHKARGRISASTAFLDAWFVRHWLHPVSESMRLAEQGEESALLDDDTLYHGYCASSYVMYLAASGRPLPEVVRAADRQLAKIAGRVRVACFHCVLERQLAQALAGLTIHRLSLTDATCNEERDVASICATTNFTQISYYYVAKMRLHYHHGEFQKAIDFGSQAQARLRSFRGEILEWTLAFYQALSLLGEARRQPEQRDELMNQAMPLCSQMANWARGNPDSFLPMSDLVQAELARLEGKHDVAGNLYRSSAIGAAKIGTTQHASLAHECAADFFQEVGDLQQAEAEWNAANSAYSEWGAFAKVSSLRARPATGHH